MGFFDAAQTIWVSSRVYLAYQITRLMAELGILVSMLALCVAGLASILASPYADRLIDFGWWCTTTMAVVAMLHCLIWGIYALRHGWRFTKHPFELAEDII